MKKTLFVILIFFVSTLSAQNSFSSINQLKKNNSYSKIEVSFMNEKEKIQLYGTLSIPNEEFEQVIIIVPGTGPDTRGSHPKLSEQFLKNNIAVYRYDERGVGKSQGKNTAYEYGISQMTEDLIYAIKTIKKENILQNKSIGLLGHSMGGMATIGAIESGIEVDFTIQWATPVQKHGEFLKHQIKTGRNSFDDTLNYDNIEDKIEIIEVVQQVIEKNINDDHLKLCKKIKKEAKQAGYTKKNYDRFSFWTFPTLTDLLKQNYEATYKNIQIPLLYIIGSYDTFINPNDNQKLLESFQNPYININIIHGLNHYLTPTLDINQEDAIYEIDQNATNQIINWTKQLTIANNEYNQSS
ncbi:MAG: alpha/beta hydrolase [Flavobacteriaceae bacterium]